MKKTSIVFILFLFVFLSGNLFAVGQGEDKAPEKIQITFMTPLAGADGAYMEQIIQRFNEENPNIEVVHLVVGSSVEYKQKLSTGLSTQSAPQVILIRKFDMPLYLDQFKGLTASELSGYGIDINDIFPSLMDGLVVDGKYLGIPLDVWIFYMAYNKANFAKAGLDPENPPMNREDFVKAMEALIPVTPEGVTPYYETPTWAWIWVHLLWQFGGDLLTDDYKKPAFQEAGVETLKFMVDLQNRGILPKAAVDAGPVFQGGDASVLITGIWTINPWIEAIGDDFGYAVAPQLGTTDAVFGGSHVLALPEVMVQDKNVMKAAMKWIKFLWDNSIDWYAAGQTPSRKSIANSEELKTRLPQIYTVAQQLSHVKTFQMFPYISEVLDEIAVYLEAVLITGEMTPDEGMNKAAESVQLILDDYWETQ